MELYILIEIHSVFIQKKIFGPICDNGKWRIRYNSELYSIYIYIYIYNIKIGSNSYEKVETFKYLGSLLTNQNSTQEEIKCKPKSGNSCYYSVQTLFVL